MPDGVDIDLLVKDAYRNQILVARGATFMADGQPDPHIRFNVVFSQHQRLADHLAQRLGALSSLRSTLARFAAKAD